MKEPFTSNFVKVHSINESPSWKPSHNTCLKSGPNWNDWAAMLNVKFTDIGLVIWKCYFRVSCKTIGEKNKINIKASQSRWSYLDIFINSAWKFIWTLIQLNGPKLLWFTVNLDVCWLSLCGPFGHKCAIDLDASKYTNTYRSFGQNLTVQRDALPQCIWPILINIHNWTVHMDN